MLVSGEGEREEDRYTLNRNTTVKMTEYDIKRERGYIYTDKNKTRERSYKNRLRYEHYHDTSRDMTPVSR